jgi:hypothetical protein
MVKMGCALILRLTKRTGQPGEREEEVVLNSHNRDDIIHMSYNEEGSRTERTTLQENHNQTGKGAANKSGSEESSHSVLTIMLIIMQKPLLTHH